MSIRQKRLRRCCSVKRDVMRFKSRRSRLRNLATALRETNQYLTRNRYWATVCRKHMQ